MQVQEPPSASHSYHIYAYAFDQAKESNQPRLQEQSALEPQVAVIASSEWAYCQMSQQEKCFHVLPGYWLVPLDSLPNASQRRGVIAHLTTLVKEQYQSHALHSQLDLQATPSLAVAIGDPGLLQLERRLTWGRVTERDCEWLVQACKEMLDALACLLTAEGVGV
jgi:hypothetical protein